MFCEVKIKNCKKKNGHSFYGASVFFLNDDFSINSLIYRTRIEVATRAISPDSIPAGIYKKILSDIMLTEPSEM